MKRILPLPCRVGKEQLTFFNKYEYPTTRPLSFFFWFFLTSPILETLRPNSVASPSGSSIPTLHITSSYPLHVAYQPPQRTPSNTNTAQAPFARVLRRRLKSNVMSIVYPCLVPFPGRNLTFD